MITTTLNKIREHRPCADGWKKLLGHLNKTEADDEPLPFSVIVKSNGLDDALWCCRAAPEHDKEWRLFGVWCARQVQHLMKDSRSLNALDVAERFANGLAMEDELKAAGAAARTAAWVAARYAADAAGDAADASGAAADAAGAAARTAAWVAARYAADAAVDAAWAARTAEDAAWEKQKQEFLRVVEVGKRSRQKHTHSPQSWARK